MYWQIPAQMSRGLSLDSEITSRADQSALNLFRRERRAEGIRMRHFFCLLAVAISVAGCDGLSKTVEKRDANLTDTTGSDTENYR